MILWVFGKILTVVYFLFIVAVALLLIDAELNRKD